MSPVEGKRPFSPPLLKGPGDRSNEMPEAIIWKRIGEKREKLHLGAKDMKGDLKTHKNQKKSYHKPKSSKVPRT